MYDLQVIRLAISVKYDTGEITSVKQCIFIILIQLKHIHCWTWRPQVSTGPVLRSTVIKFIIRCTYYLQAFKLFSIISTGERHNMPARGVPCWTAGAGRVVSGVGRRAHRTGSLRPHTR